MELDPVRIRSSSACLRARPTVGGGSPAPAPRAHLPPCRTRAAVPPSRSPQCRHADWGAPPWIRASVVEGGPLHLRRPPAQARGRVHPHRRRPARTSGGIRGRQGGLELRCCGRRAWTGVGGGGHRRAHAREGEEAGGRRAGADAGREDGGASPLEGGARREEVAGRRAVQRGGPPAGAGRRAPLGPGGARRHGLAAARPAAGDGPWLRRTAGGGGGRRRWPGEEGRGGVGREEGWREIEREAGGEGGRKEKKL